MKVFLLQKFRGTVQTILRTAKDEGVQSIAFPSLGVGNLNYPAETSAKILFEEIITFHERNPTSDLKFHFVIYDQSAYLAFSKEYAQKMNSAPAKKKVSLSKSVTPLPYSDMPVLYLDIWKEQQEASRGQS